jgi:hypothetical protein
LSQPKKRPGRLWLFFYGRQRRGVPFLLIGVLLAMLVFALIFALPNGADYSRVVAVFFFALLLAGIAAAVVLAVFFPRRRR